MHCTCVRQSDLPNTTRLFADVLYHPDRTAPFYQHPLRGLEAFQAAFTIEESLDALLAWHRAMFERGEAERR